MSSHRRRSVTVHVSSHACAALEKATLHIHISRHRRGMCANETGGMNTNSFINGHRNGPRANPPFVRRGRAAISSSALLSFEAGKMVVANGFKKKKQKKKSRLMLICESILDGSQGRTPAVIRKPLKDQNACTLALDPGWSRKLLAPPRLVVALTRR